MLPPGRFEEAVAQAVERIRAGELEKVVLAREVVVEAPRAHDPAAIYGALRELFPSCFCFCCGSPEAAFLGASPELLVRRSGAGAATVALAGSTRRSADPAVDDHLGEQLLRSAKDRREHEIVVRRIERALRRHSVWVEAAPEPGLVKVANIQHLATPIHAQLSEPRSAVELAGLLHPTPAVGGEPRDRALAAIAELEELDRGWYAGPVGWMDAAEDGEFCVAIRSALLRDRTAHLFAGNGIVADSDPDGRAGRDRGQARGAAAAARRLRLRRPSAARRAPRRPAPRSAGEAPRFAAGRPGSRSAPSPGRRRPPSRSSRSTRAWGRSYSAAIRAGSSPSGVPSSASNSSRSSCSAWGRNSKIPPPSLLSTTIRTGALACAKRGEAVHVVVEAEVAGDDPGRAAGWRPRRRCPRRSGRRSRSRRGCRGTAPRVAADGRNASWSRIGIEEAV